MLRVDLFDIFIQDISETLPTTFRNQDGVAVVPLHLGYGHVSALLVPLDVKVEILVLNPDVFVLRPRNGFFGVTVVIFINQLPEVVLELAHSVRWNEHLEPGVAAGERLRHFEEPSPCILLQIHVILLVIFVHHLRLQLALPQVVWVQLLKFILIEINELDQVLTEQCRSREGHQDLILSAIS